MKEFIDKLISRLEEAKVSANRRNAFDSEVSYACAIDIVNELAEEYNREHDDTDYANIELYAFWKNHQWIPCSERLPEVNGWYLVTNNLGVVQQLYWGASRWHKMCDWDVIAWMPLPAPYTEGE